MGALEEKTRIKIRNTKIQKAVLGTIGVAGLLSVALLAPNALQALGMFNIGKNNNRNLKRSISISRDRLIKVGLVQYDKGFLQLTKNGEAEFCRLARTNFKINKPKRWDKKWRIVIFDIKEKVLKNNVGKIAAINNSSRHTHSELSNSNR